MASSRPFSSRNSLLPSPTRPRRSTIASSSPRKPQYIEPTAPVHSKQPTNPKFPISPENPRTPKPCPQSSPSRLPRPSFSTPRKQHRPSISLEAPCSPSPPLTVKKKNVRNAPLPSSSPRRLLTVTAAPPSVIPSSLASPIHRNVKPRRSSIKPKVDSLHISVPTISLTAVQPAPQKIFKRDPRRVLCDLGMLLGSGQMEKLNGYLPLDILMAIHERELMEGEARLQRANSIKSHSEGSSVARGSTSTAPTGVFGFPLRQITLYASTKTALGGFEHDLPIVVFACVEELYRAGISTPSNPTPTSPSPNVFLTRRTLSSSPMDDKDGTGKGESRIDVLFSIFDSPKDQFGLLSSLKDEASNDVYGLLTAFLSHLPEPVLAPVEIVQGLRDALWTWCIRPQRGDAPISSLPSMTLVKRVEIARLLLGLLPTPNLSLFVYLMAFSCQILDVRVKRREARNSLAFTGTEGAAEISALEAQMLAMERELEEKNAKEREKIKLGRVWGAWLFGNDSDGEGNHVVDGEVGEESRSTRIMAWMVSHWGDIIRGFLEPGVIVDFELLAPSLGEAEPEFNKVCRGEARNKEGDMGDIDHSVILQAPLTESLFTSSASLSRLRLGAKAGPGSAESTPRQPRWAMATDTLVPPEVEHEASVHSRYSLGHISSDESRKTEESEAMMKESSSSSTAALDERLCSLETDPGQDACIPLKRISAQTIPPSLDDSEPNLLRSNSITDAEIDYFSRLGPLRVVNGSDSDFDSRLASGSEFTACSSANDTPPSSDGSVVLKLSTGPKPCNQCVEGCPIHVYARELEIRLAALVEENLALRLGSKGS
ncbi:hypothetical protein D9757_012464 [Collybiopsis confluens]|uniref:Rho-GAP domain-containing protein n=1 Tax=Collybiopsis confluens TaxID=2823264 RepID=A0A8H5G1B0_9AGAR|nr:hypothetical protein D9757_012464 [Collybiopsis confluens]